MFSNTCAMTLAQKSDRILAQTRGLSGATPNATQLIEELRWALEENRREVERLTTERDEARRMYCEEVEHHHETVWNDGERDFKPLLALDVAISKGWDCFKEDSK
jgi:hypothetical protein